MSYKYDYIITPYGFPDIWLDISNDELLELYEETYDRWNFETGSDDDFQAMKDLEKEITYRKYVDHCVNVLSKKDYKEIMEGLIIGDSE